MLKPAYQLLRFSKGERLFVFQKRLLSGIKSSPKLNFRLRRSNHGNNCVEKMECFNKVTIQRCAPNSASFCKQLIYENKAHAKEGLISESFFLFK